MSEFIAALPMYDWVEATAETDALWMAIRERLVVAGVDVPARLARRNADLPPVTGGLRDAAGVVVAPDPAMLPPDEFDFHALWLHPKLLLAQTCWGPMELGLQAQVQLVGQPDYSGFEGGQGALYSSAIVMRRSDAVAHRPFSGASDIPLDRIRGRRFTFNGLDSMSGIIALTRDLGALGENLDMFSERIESGGHRASIVAVAEDRADIATIDCRSWALAQRFEPAAAEVEVVGWTGPRKGLPFITSLQTPPLTVEKLRAALGAAGQAA